VLYREGLSGNILLLAIGVLILAILSLIMRETMFHIPFWGKAVGGQYFLIGLITVVCLLSFYVVSRFVMKRQRRRLYGFIAFALIRSAVFISGFDFAYQNVLSERHRTRIGVTLGLVYDPQGLGYNAEQSKTAIGSGGFLGKGYLDGTFTKYKYVPEQQTDFIFCTVGEEWGFVGTTVIVLLFGARKLPELARGTGQALRIFKDETKGLRTDDETKTPEQREIEARQVEADRLREQRPDDTTA